MSKMLSNQKIIDELNKITTDYIKTRPKMTFKPFVSNKAERDYNLGDNRGGFKSMGQHPFPGSRSETFYPDPLFGGAMYKTMADYINRNSNYGGALLSQNMPLTGGEHSDSDYLSESDYSSCSSSDSESDYDSDYEGGDIYEDYVKPVAKGVYDVGREIVVPVGKELLKEAILGLMMGAGNKMEGGLSGTKKEFIHILKAMYPQIDFNKKTKAELLEEIKKAMKKMEETPKETNIVIKKRGRPAKTQFTPSDNLEMQRKVADMFLKTKREIAKQIKEDKKIVNPLLKKIKPVKEKAPPKPKVVKEKAPPKPKAPTKAQIKAERVAKDKARRENEKENIRLNKLDKERLKIVIKRDKMQEKLDNAKGKATKDKYEAERDKYDIQLQEFDMENNYKPYDQRQKEKYAKIFNPEGGKIKKIVGTKKGERVRGDIVAEIMKKKGLNLAQASKYVKEHGLY